MNFFLAASLLLCAFYSASAEEQIQSGDVKCFVCTSVVTALEGLVTKNTTIAAFETEVNKTCHKLHISSFCDSFLLPFLPQILNDLIAKEPASKVCQQIKLCPSTVAVPKVVEEVEVKSGDVKCFVCTTVVTALEGFVTKNTTITAFETEVNKTCHKLHISTFCDSFLLPFLPQILNDLIAKEPASKVCQQIKLCPSTVAVPKPQVQSGDVKCFVCTSVITALEGLVTKNETIAAFSKAVNSTCHKLHISTFCDSFLLPFLPQILTDLVEKEPASKICQQIHLCPTTPAAFVATTVEAKEVKPVEPVAKHHLKHGRHGKKQH